MTFGSAMAISMIGLCCGTPHRTDLRFGITVTGLFTLQLDDQLYACWVRQGG
jgi:hypothetical protein